MPFSRYCNHLGWNKIPTIGYPRSLYLQIIVVWQRGIQHIIKDSRSIITLCINHNRQIMAEPTREDIANKLKGIERYNPLHVDILTAYLDSQCSNNHYDLEANSAILKLYQFNPTLFKSEIVEKILLKALTNLPHPDFILCELLIDSTKLNQGNIQDIVLMHNRLETCQFKSFWSELNGQEDLFKDIVGFKESIRSFVCHIVGITYQNIRSSLLQDLLGLGDNQEEYKSWLTKKEWRLNEDGYVTVANQGDRIKTINITEKIELEQVANILATYR